MSFGRLRKGGASVEVEGQRIFSIPDEAADDLISNSRALADIAASLSATESFSSEMRRAFEQDKNYRRYVIDRYLGGAARRLPRNTRVSLQNAAMEAEDLEDFQRRSGPIKASLQSSQEEIASLPLKVPMSTFGGTVRRLPEYATSILGSMKTNKIHLQETKQPIGPEEALQLLLLKTTRGGPVRLTSLQQVVKALLGVSVDAFSGDADIAAVASSPKEAEMDVDDFIIEANGAGIREALRIVLDIELKKPDIVLIEEPEVHLHPALEKAMHEYLIDRGAKHQTFVATHSTNFLDVSSRQSIFIVSRKGTSTLVEEAISETDILRIPSDLGLRPSSVFMFDKLVFVEGPSDEGVLRAFAKTLSIDLASKNIGFVKMGGASNMPYFSADSMLDLLSKRQIPMLFILDRDERKELEIAKISKRLGGRARTHFFSKREIENYLFDEEALRRLIDEKIKTKADKHLVPDVEQVRVDINEAALSMQQRAVDLAVRSSLLQPVYVSRNEGSTAKEKIEASITSLQARAKSFEEDASKIADDVNIRWPKEARDRAPGSEVLEKIAQKYECAFHKERDSARLASFIPAGRIDRELEGLVREL